MKAFKGGDALEDRQIVELYWQRQSAAITETAAKYGAYCRTVAYNILSNTEDAEECVNDTYMSAWNAMPDKRLVLAIQPHTYSRTSALFEDFVRELGKADVLVLAEIYAARERNTFGISSAHVAEKIPGAVYCETLPEVTEYLRANVREGDVVITMGAGDIFRAGEALLGKN